MGANGLDEYWVPEHVKDYLRKLGCRHVSAKRTADGAGRCAALACRHVGLPHNARTGCDRS